MNPQLIIAALIAAAGFASGWHVQTIRYTAKEAQNAKQELVQIRQSAATTVRRMDNTLLAENAATDRAVVLRRDLDGARTELERLRITLTHRVPGTATATGACAVGTPAVDQLLFECAADLTEMAGKADRHANDAKTLSEAWPK